MSRWRKRYASIEDFEREEIRSELKAGWSIDDIYIDAFEPSSDEFWDEELDFERGRRT
ncbi:MAG: hypothetical protein N2515_03710 [Deltaproteobacteria bacterium]|nr:hypothetical protein [Deltaproteobacteria bacterium]MDW8246532.1 hypothetical protein [Sandaracinaceae bacterium]